MTKIFHPASLGQEALPESFSSIDFFGAITKVNSQIGGIINDVE